MVESGLSVVADRSLTSKQLGAFDDRLPCRYPVFTGRECADFRSADLSATVSKISLRKEVIQPQVPLRLPCYDLVPVTELTVDTTETWRLRVLPASMT